MPVGAVVTAWLGLTFLLGLVWLLANYPSNPADRPFPNSCKSIAQSEGDAGQGQHQSDSPITAITQAEASANNSQSDAEQERRANERRLTEYTCQLAVYTAQLATFTKWLVFVTIAVAGVGIWQGFQLSRHASHLEGTAQAAQTSAEAALGQLRIMIAAESSVFAWSGFNLEQVSGIFPSLPGSVSPNIDYRPVATVKNLGRSPLLLQAFCIETILGDEISLGEIPRSSRIPSFLTPT
jgi:hypothetical protein